MLIKGLIDDDFVNYRKISMFVICHSCCFKCDKLNGTKVCQNSKLAHLPDIEISPNKLINRYLQNDISEAIVFAGLEPFEDIDNIMLCINYLRIKKNNNDDVVIYTGYTEDEIKEQFATQYELLKTYKNIIIKYGRFIPNQQPHWDPVLGISLASDNQYAIRIC